jgi:hypothetical protein
MAADEDSAPKAGDKSEAGKPARRPRPPVTIDLAASVVPPPDPVAPDAPAEKAGASDASVSSPLDEAAAPRNSDPRQSGPPPAGAIRSSPSPVSNWVGLFVAGLVGGLIVLLFGYGLGGIGGGGTRDAVEATAAAQKQLGDSLAALDKRVAAIEGRPAPADPAARIAELSTRLGALETTGAATASRVAKVESDLAAMPPPSPAQPQQNLPATTQVLDDLLQRVDRLEETSSVPPIIGDRISALETSTAVLSGRLDALADQMQAMSAKPTAAEDSEKAARAVAIGTLRQAAERGGSFTADLAMIEALAIAPADVAALKPLAEKGAPAKDDLAAEFPAVGDAILAAAVGGSESGGIVDRLIAHARGLITVRPVGPIAGDTPAAIVSRLQAAVDKGDLAAALKERDGLPDSGKAASAAWAEAAADRVAIDRLVGKLVAALGAPRPAE